MEFRFSPQEEAFRQDVREWLKHNLPANWQEDRFTRDRDPEAWNIYKGFARRLAKKKWVAPHWPVQYGGLGLTVIEQLIFNEEMAYHNAPIGYSSIGVGWAGPTIIVYGSEEQKRRHLGAITNADTMWCQGFSEPNAGSDLASLQTRAARDGDPSAALRAGDYVINGQKIWTSGAHYADWMILLARTDPDAPKHKGISYFLLDTKTPGITIRPLIDMMNNHGFNEVFFENVRVPKDSLLGEENRGWYMATTTLDFERSSIGGAAGSRKLLEDLAEYVKEHGTLRLRSGQARNREQGTLRLRSGQAGNKEQGPRPTQRGDGDGVRVRTRLADATVEVEIGRFLSYRVASMQARGLVPNYESSIAKLFNTEMQLRLARAGLEIMGLYGQLEPRSKWVPLRGRFERQYLWQTGMVVGGGTSEIQRNIIATRGLGLPRG